MMLGYKIQFFRHMLVSALSGERKVNWIQLKAGKPNPPFSEGALIVDEIKVAAKLHWNSWDVTLVGHSMTPHNLSTLQHLYHTVNDDSKACKADYVLYTNHVVGSFQYMRLSRTLATVPTCCDLLHYLLFKPTVLTHISQTVSMNISLEVQTAFYSSVVIV